LPFHFLLLPFKDLKVAIVADWLTNFAGAEKVILTLHHHFPDAPIYTTIYNSKKMPGFEEADIRTSFLQHWPFAKKKHQLFLKWMPLAVESFDLSEYDIVISSSHSCAKGIITKPETLHICYCHTPMRYAWDDCHNYIRNSNLPWLVKKMVPFMMQKIRLWDRLAADRVDHFIANSSFVAERIQKYYGRESEVINPPVDTENFHISEKPEEYFLAVGRLIPYKKFDLLVETFNQLGLPLKIVGTGPEEKKLRQIAKENIELLGHISNEELRKTYANCKAFLFPQIEDFGIVPIEAMASGRPVIALKKGGALDSIQEGVTGIFFEEQTPESLTEAIKKLEKTTFDPQKIRQHAQEFNSQRFLEKLDDFIQRKWQKNP